jgi:uncharacterized protein (DUF58 family)
MTGIRADRWRPTVALLSAFVVVIAALVLAVVVRRPDLVVVATPLVVGALTALLRGPSGTHDDAVRLDVPHESVWEGDRTVIGIEVGSDALVDLARVAVQHGAGITVDGGYTVQCLLPQPDRAARTGLPLRAVRWGRTLVGPAAVVFTGAHGLLRRDGPSGSTEAMTIVPLRSVFDATDTVPQASGLVGTHRSRRPGNGTDLLTIRPFAPGDRLKRITWPVSLRTGQLHVTTTTDDRDTDVQLIVDTAVGVGDERGSSLDVTVRAAASVAEHYLRQGDRVGLIDLGSPRSPVRLNAGRRHMTQILAALLTTSGGGSRLDDERTARRLVQVPPRALVMVFSTLLDDSIGRTLATLAKGGHTVVVIDTLPPDVTVTGKSDWLPLAWRIALLARSTLTDRLREFGVPVVAWRGARSLDQVLIGLSRAALIPRRRR